MLIVPHTAELDLAQKPWVTWLVIVLCLLIHFAQDNSRDEVLDAAMDYCGEVIADQTKADESIWNNIDECAEEMAGLHSLPDPELFLVPPKDAAKFFYESGPEDIAYYYEIYSAQYHAFAQIAPPSLDAKLSYDPTVPNPWRMVTSALAHSDWWHVIGNLVFFLAFAPILELLSGSAVRFIVIMVIITVADGLVYSLATLASGWPAATLGLSGVVMGMIGLAAYVVPRVRIRTLVWFFIYIRNHSFPAWLLAAWFIGWDAWYLLTTTDHGGVNLVSHVSGGVTGYLIGMFMLRKQRDLYREDIDEAVEYQRQKRSALLPSHDGSNIGNQKHINESRRVRNAEADYESLMEDVYTAVSTYQDSEAVMLLLDDYDLWSASPEVYEEIFHRMEQWGSSSALFCTGRLLIHLYAKMNQTAKAQAITAKCLALSPEFILGDKLDLANMFQGVAGVQGQKMQEQLRKNMGR